MNCVMFGNRIRKGRRAKHITQEELAAAAGISLSFLGHIERGTRKVSVETLIRIASVLGTTPDALLKDSIDAQVDMLSIFPEPTDHFANIRKELKLLEDMYLGNRLT